MSKTANKDKAAFARPIGEYKTVGDGKWNGQQIGLTKREYMVGQILAGDIGGLANTADIKRCAKYAIELADEVLNKLEE